MVDAIIDLDAFVDSLDTALTALDAQVATNTANITANQTNIGVNAGNIANVQANIVTIEANIATNEAAISANTANITANDQDIADNANAIAANTANITTNTGDITTNQTAIGQHDTELDDHETRITALETFNTNTLSTTIQNAIDAALVDVNADITNLETTVNNLQTQIAALEAELDDVADDVANGVGGASYILGVTDTAYNGRVSVGTLFGIQAASAACQSKFTDDANAHMCSPAEVVEAISTVGYDETDNSWDGVSVWAVTDITRRHNTEQNFAAASDNHAASCNTLMYNSGHEAKGTTMQVFRDLQVTGGGGGLLSNGATVLYDANVACNSSHRILCCR